MNVMVWYFVSGTHNVIITLILLVFVLVWLEPRQHLFGCLKCSVEAFLNFFAITLISLLYLSASRSEIMPTGDGTVSGHSQLELLNAFQHL
jgi:hypothetical protein